MKIGTVVKMRVGITTAPIEAILPDGTLKLKGLVDPVEPSKVEVFDPEAEAKAKVEAKAKREKAKRLRAEEEAEATAKARAEAEATAKAAKKWQADLESGFGMKWRVVRSRRAITATPNETFWGHWKSDRQNEIRAMGFRVSKGVDYYVELDTAGDEYQRTHVQFGERVISIDMVEEVFGVEPQPEPEPQGDPLRPVSANQLIEEVGETDDDEFRQIHGYEEDDGTYGRI